MKFDELIRAIRGNPAYPAISQRIGRLSPRQLFYLAALATREHPEVLCDLERTRYRPSTDKAASRGLDSSNSGGRDAAPGGRQACPPAPRQLKNPRGKAAAYKD